MRKAVSAKYRFAPEYNRAVLVGVIKEEVALFNYAGHRVNGENSVIVKKVCRGAENTEAGMSFKVCDLLFKAGQIVIIVAIVARDIFTLGERKTPIKRLYKSEVCFISNKLYAVVCLGEAL